MLHLIPIAFYFSALFMVVCAWEHISELELQFTLKNNHAVVIAFINFETQWSLATLEVQIPLASVDCTANPSICHSNELSSSFVVKLFVQGELTSTYNGPQRASAILAWINRAQRPTVSQVNVDALDNFKNADETVFIAYVRAHDETFKTAFAEVAALYCEEFTFGLFIETTAFEAETVTAPLVRCYKVYDGDTHDFANFADPGALEGFVKKASRPIIGELLPHNHQRFLDRGWPMVYVFATTEIERSEIRKELKDMARSYYESLTMVTVDPLEFPDLLVKLGLEPGVFPAGVVHQLSKDRIYHYPKGRGMTSNDLQSWGLDVWQGRVKPWTPLGVTSTYTDLSGRIKATQRISMRYLPGVDIRVAGHDEL
ncbi:hypothetical protein F5B20DRAFT_22875 [Whalleya microplaca]|nr:hypothetical protein F5B20DRAFT_22875 [Whalleya microplaca]